MLNQEPSQWTREIEFSGPWVAGDGVAGARAFQVERKVWRSSRRPSGICRGQVGCRVRRVVVRCEWWVGELRVCVRGGVGLGVFHGHVSGQWEGGRVGEQQRSSRGKRQARMNRVMID